MVAIAGLVVLGGTFAVAQFASADDNDSASCGDTSQVSTQREGQRGQHRNHGGRPRPGQPAPDASEPGQEQPGGDAEGDGEDAQGTQPPAQDCEEDGQGDGQGGDGQGGDGQGGDGQGGDGQGGGAAPPPNNNNNNGLDVLGQDCSNSRLQPHTGFQEGGRCVSTAFGEVGTANQNPSLLITNSPRQVRVNQGFTLQVSTRNLIRDRFLGAAAGGYYLESSFLNGQGLQRGHFHTACRVLDSTRQAPDPEPAPAFFKATEDGGGSGQPDTVEVEVTGIPEAGTAQCAVWAGDGSHRTPMMERANQTPAIDVVRIRVAN